MSREDSGVGWVGVINVSQGFRNIGGGQLQSSDYDHHFISNRNIDNPE